MCFWSIVSKHILHANRSKNGDQYTSVSLQTFFCDRHPPELLEAWADPALQRAAREILRVCAPQALASVVG